MTDLNSTNPELPQLDEATSKDVRRLLRQGKLQTKDVEKIVRLCRSTVRDADLLRLIRLGDLSTTERWDVARVILGPYLAPEDDPHGRELFELAMSLGSNSGDER